MLSISRSPVVRALVIVLALGAWLTVAALGGPAQGRLSQVQTNDAAAFLPAAAESTRAGEAARAFIDTESLPALVVLRPAGRRGRDAGAARRGPGFAAGIGDARAGGRRPGRRATRRPSGTSCSADAVVVPAEDGEALLVALSLDGAAPRRCWRTTPASWRPS